MNNCILLRYGEIGLKSKRTRGVFEKHYLNSIRDALKRNYLEDFKIENYGGRFVLYTKQIDETIEVLKRVAGIQSISPAKRIKFTSKENLIKELSKLTKNSVKNKTFGIKVKRVGNHKFDSVSLAKDVGSEIYNNSKGVNLTTPDIWISLEVRANECFLYYDSIDTIGGLPSASSDKVLCLFSGGIDSPVAAFEMNKRGCKVDFLFMNIMGEKLLNDVSRVYNFLITNYTFGYTPKIYILNGKKIIDLVKKEVPSSLRQLAYKIILYKVSEQIASSNKHIALVTGESLAQKSSQTLKSLVFIEKQVDIPILRPLLSFDKLDIIKVARKIGTFSASEKIKEYCNLSDGSVTTSPRASDIKNITLHEDFISKMVQEVKITHNILELKEDKPNEIKKKR